MSLSKIMLTKLFLFWVTLNVMSAQQGLRADEYIRKADELKKSMKPDSAIMYYVMAATEYESIGKTEQWVDACNQIGIILTRQDKYDEAKQYLEKALTGGLSLPDTNNLLVANSYISLGVVYSAEEDYNRSLDYHFKALDIRLQKLGEYDAQVATSYGNIGNVYRYAGQYDPSIEAHTKAMNIREALFGEESPEIIESYAGLGNAYREKKEYDKALMCFQKALNNKIIQRGEGHKDLAKYYTYISEVYYLMGDTVQGELYKNKATGLAKP